MSGTAPPGGTAPVVIVAGPPGTGKTTVGRLVARGLRGVLVDRDVVLAPIVAAALSAAGQDPYDLDADYFRTHLNGACYQAAEDLAASIAADGVPAVLAAPYSRAGEPGWHARLADRLGAPLAVVWLTAPAEVLRARVAGRGAPRDRRTLDHWPARASGPGGSRRPDGPHLALDTAGLSPPACAARVLAHLSDLGWATVGS